MGRRGGRAADLGAAATVAGLVGMRATRAWRRQVPRRTVLLLDLVDPPPPEVGDPLARLAARRRPTLRTIVEALERAETDRRVRGLLVLVGAAPGGLADVQELRDAIGALRGAGTPTVAFSEAFGEFGPGTGGYYLASVCDEIVLQPSGDVGLLGVRGEATFLRGALDKLGAEPELDHRRAYKTAKNRLTETAFTEADREATGRIVTSVLDQVVAGVATARGLDEATVRGLVDRAPLLAEDARAAGLVDRLGYRDAAVDRARALADGTRSPAVGRARARAGDRVALLDLAAYAARGQRRRVRGGTTVALVHGTGAVVAGRGRPSPLARRVMGSAEVGDALRRAAADRTVHAVLFRVDSPGGSYAGSDAIWREVARTRERGTPVVVSMGNVAGSGGYFVAAGADRIVAQPATLTGSIGVLGGKVVTRGLRERLGLTSDAVDAGASAGMFATTRPFAPAEWERLQAWLDRVYADFTGKVAAGRGLSAEAVETVAQGRVWTGADALERGLVDALGGHRTALGQVREVLGLPRDAPLRLVPFPRRGLRERLERARSGRPSDDLLRTAGDLLRLAGAARAAAPALDGLADLEAGVLTAPDLPTLRW